MLLPINFSLWKYTLQKDARLKSNLAFRDRQVLEKPIVHFCMCNRCLRSLYHFVITKREPKANHAFNYNLLKRMHHP